MKFLIKPRRNMALAFALLIALLPGAASVARTDNATLSDPVATQNIEPEAGQSDEKIKSRIENIFLPNCSRYVR
jgi:hypothetical protein